MDPTWGADGSVGHCGRFSDNSGVVTESEESNKDLAFITTDGLPSTGLGDDNLLTLGPSESQLFCDMSTDGRSTIPQSGSFSNFLVTGFNPVVLLLFFNESSGTGSDLGSSGTFGISSADGFSSA